MNKRSCLLLAFVLILPAVSVAVRGQDRLRVIVLTDIENEPDDTQSMVRFLTYSNQWDIEGLIATTSVHQRNRTAPEKIAQLIEAYSKVRNNLVLHEPGFPEAAYLHSITKSGYKGFGMDAVGVGKDSEGSEWIIQVLEKEDDRPVWILVWGGANCLAQALWKISMTRTPDETDRLVSKIRVHTISDQDDSGPWIRKTFPNLFHVGSLGYHAAGAYHHSTWTGISGDNFHGRFSGADFGIVDHPWLDEHVRTHGPLGAEYPQTKFLMEGDTPSFLGLINNGLNAPERPDFGGWGGRYEWYTPRTQKWFYEPETRPVYTNAEDEVMGVDGKFHTSNKATIWRWREAYQNDFAARMDWTVKRYAEANHPPIVVLEKGNQLTTRSGEKVKLSAAKSSDPDGNRLVFQWIEYSEAGTYASKDRLKLENADSSEMTFTVPPVSRPVTLHLIIAVTDDGSPKLTRYQRVIVTVLPKL